MHTCQYMLPSNLTLENCSVTISVGSIKQLLHEFCRSEVLKLPISLLSFISRNQALKWQELTTATVSIHQWVKFLAISVCLLDTEMLQKNL